MIRIKIMQQKKRSTLSSKCSVCAGPSAYHLHYGAVSCYSCRAFFRRGIGKPYCCVEGTGDCSIDWTSRRSCQWCRFDKCLRVGMNPELVDAALRKKSYMIKSFTYEGTALIDNLEPLEDIGVISDVLKDIAYENVSDQIHLSSSDGDFGNEKVDPCQYINPSYNHLSLV